MNLRIWQTLLTTAGLSWASGTAGSEDDTNLVQAWFGHCPEGNGWREAPFMCWRESFHRRDFGGALEYCYYDDLSNGPFNNLMPVGKLRKFDVLAKNEDKEDKVFWNEDGPFRVNAIKNERCEWVEFPSGKKVPFHHFPDFDQTSGRPGDTLIWYPKSNRLAVENADAILNVLCYRPKQGIGKRCADFDWNDNECNDAGDCWRGKCICDEKFAGYKCQLTPPPEVNALIIGGQGLTGPLQSVEIYDIANHGSCLSQHPYPEQIFGSVGAWIEKKCYGPEQLRSFSFEESYSGSSSSSSSSSRSSRSRHHSSSSSSSFSSSSSESEEDRRSHNGGHRRGRLDTRGLSREDDSSSSGGSDEGSLRHEDRAVVCGGVTGNDEVVNSCFSLDRERQQWVIEPYMKEERAYAAGAIVSPRGDWFVVGGMNHNNSYLASSELLDVLDAVGSGEDIAGLWHHGPRLHHRTWKPCLVQISDCETAMIGGFRSNSDSSQISIYNWHHREWRQGPYMSVGREAAGCARIRNPFTNSLMVMITGGFNDATKKYLGSVELWDTETNEMMIPPISLPRAMDDHVLLEVGDHQLLLIGGDSAKATTSVYRFDFDHGFVADGDLLTARQGHVGMLVPKHYARCKLKKHKRKWDSDSKQSSWGSSSDSSSSSSESHSHHSREAKHHH